MKKILFVIPGLSHGGTNRALLNMLQVIDTSRYKIEILALTPTGPYKEFLAKYTLLPRQNLIYFYSIPFKSVCSSKFRRSEGFIGTIKFIFVKCYTKLFLKSDFHRIEKKTAKRLSQNNYDVVVAFQEELVTEFCSFINAKKKIAWVHCDYSRCNRDYSLDPVMIYSAYDHIVAVSEATATNFCQIIPEVSDKVMCIHNVLIQSEIKKMAKKMPEDDRFCTEDFTLVSLGRIDPVKRFSAIPEMALYLKNSGIPFRWYIIGEGDEAETQKIKKKIQECGVSKNVILLGIKDNPYPYIARASVLICPSSSEACPYVVNEARALHVPVVAADFASAIEFVQNGVNGFIAPLDQIATILEKLYRNEDIYRRIKENISDFLYDNLEIKKTVEDLLDRD